jgi:hypothetical protein
MYQLRIAHLYPEQMNIYGDRGNILTLMQRCRWRDIQVDVDGIAPNRDVDWARYDLAFFGGGQDSGQSLIAEDFVQRHGPSVKAAVDDGLVLLAICGGYQLLGHYFLTHTGETLPGIGAMDLHTVGGSQRLIGNIVIETDLVMAGAERSSSDGQIVQSNIATLVGFENHSGRTYLGSGVAPLGRVLRGYGNNGEDNTEGARYQNAHGCYMHGSLLPKNPHFADHLLSLAFQRRYGAGTRLPALDDTLELHAHSVMVERLTT